MTEKSIKPTTMDEEKKESKEEEEKGKGSACRREWTENHATIVKAMTEFYPLEPDLKPLVENACERMVKVPGITAINSLKHAGSLSAYVMERCCFHGQNRPHFVFEQKMCELWSAGTDLLTETIVRLTRLGRVLGRTRVEVKPWRGIDLAAALHAGIPVDNELEKPSRCEDPESKRSLGGFSYSTCALSVFQSKALCELISECKSLEPYTPMGGVWLFEDARDPTLQRELTLFGFRVVSSSDGTSMSTHQVGAVYVRETTCRSLPSPSSTSLHLSEFERLLASGSRRASSPDTKEKKPETESKKKKKKQVSTRTGAVSPSSRDVARASVLHFVLFTDEHGNGVTPESVKVRIESAHRMHPFPLTLMVDHRGCPLTPSNGALKRLVSTSPKP